MQPFLNLDLAILQLHLVSSRCHPEVVPVHKDRPG
jgi:hypothetical protein